MNPRCLCEVPADKRGYYGLRLWMMLRDHHKPLPRWVWPLYWRFQPIRCLLTFHDWYGEAAGLCAACRCGASAPYPPSLMHAYRWRPWLRRWADRLNDAEYRAEFWYEQYMDRLREEAERVPA